MHGDPPLNAFIAGDPDDVLAQARAPIGRIQAGQALRIFDTYRVAVSSNTV